MPIGHSFRPLGGWLAIQGKLGSARKAQPPRRTYIHKGVEVVVIMAKVEISMNG